MHKELNEYKSFQGTVESFLRNKHFLLYGTLINLCQSRITTMLDEINEYANFINTTNNNTTTDNTTHNNYEQVSYTCSQVKLSIEQLKESFNKLDKDLTQFNQNDTVTLTETPDNLRIFSTLILLINSDVFNTFTSHLEQSINEFSILNSKSLRELQQIYHHDIIKHSIGVYQSTIDELKALSEANQSIDSLKQNETVLMDKYTNQVKLYEESQQTINQLEDQLKLVKGKSNQLSNELLEKESLVSSSSSSSSCCCCCVSFQLDSSYYYHYFT
ncbi:unnamed protein product [Trichobilharzia regenti]|nr:unnamed protein product [Trichobilharzia regenti]